MAGERHIQSVVRHTLVELHTHLELCSEFHTPQLRHSSRVAEIHIPSAVVLRKHSIPLVASHTPQAGRRIPREAVHTPPAPAAAEAAGLGVAIPRPDH